MERISAPFYEAVKHFFTKNEPAKEILPIDSVLGTSQVYKTLKRKHKYLEKQIKKIFNTIDNADAIDWGIFSAVNSMYSVPSPDYADFFSKERLQLLQYQHNEKFQEYISKDHKIQKCPDGIASEIYHRWTAATMAFMVSEKVVTLQEKDYEKREYFSLMRSLLIAPFTNSFPEVDREWVNKLTANLMDASKEPIERRSLLINFINIPQFQSKRQI